MIAALGVVCALVLALRLALYDDGAGYARIYFGLDTRVDSLMFGAILAFLLHQSMVRERIPRWLVWVGLSLIGAGCLMPHGIQVRAMPTVVGVGTAIVMYSIAQDEGFAPFSWRWVRWIGKRSYGLYLYQAPVNVFLLLTVTREKWIQLFVIAGTFLVAALSYHYIEQPFLRLKDRDRRSNRCLEGALEQLVASSVNGPSQSPLTSSDRRNT